MAAERSVELIVTALRATHDSGEWADGGVQASDGSMQWELETGWLRRWRPSALVDRAVGTLQPVDE